MPLDWPALSTCDCDGAVLDAGEEYMCDAYAKLGGGIVYVKGRKAQHSKPPRPLAGAQLIGRMVVTLSEQIELDVASSAE